MLAMSSIGIVMYMAKSTKHAIVGKMPYPQNKTSMVQLRLQPQAPSSLPHLRSASAYSAVWGRCIRVAMVTRGS